MKLNTIFLSFVVLLSLYTMPGCTNKCKGVNCPINGECDPETGACMIDYCQVANCGTNGICNPANGVCICQNGYQGTHCDTTWSAKFLNPAGWAAADTVTLSTAGSALGRFTYIPVIAATGPAVFRVSNMSGFADSNIEFSLTSTTNFTCNDTDAANRVYTGSGSINGSKISLTYRVTFSNATYDAVSATWTKN